MNYDFSTIKYDRISVLLRILFSLVISSVLALVLPFILLLVTLELGLALIKGARPPLAIMQITDRLVCYVYQMIDYLVLKDSRLPFPFSALPPPSAQFTSTPEELLSSSDYADAEDVTIVSASSEETAAVCSLADAEDVTLSDQAGYQASNTPEGIVNSEPDQDDIDLSEVAGDGLDETEVQFEELDETVLSPERDESALPEQSESKLPEQSESKLPEQSESNAANAGTGPGDPGDPGKAAQAVAAAPREVEKANPGCV